MTTSIRHAATDDEISSTFEVMKQFRPHIKQQSYVEIIRGLMASDGLKLLVLYEEKVVRPVAAYWIMNMLYCERLIYIDDLVATEHVRSRGYGTQLIARLREEDRASGCKELQLISCTTREQAHRL